MKIPTLIAVMLLSLVFLNCSTDEIVDLDTNISPNFRVIEGNINGTQSRYSYTISCMTVNLIAGQNEIAGTVNVDTDGEDLIITYRTNQDWTIDATHLSIGDCDIQSMPTTGSGNPKIGKFDHSTKHSNGINEVSYFIDLSVFSEDNYCFAAHAVVTNMISNETETAWAEGIDFGGNSWAMYVEGLLSYCNIVDVVK